MDFQIQEQIRFEDRILIPVFIVSQAAKIRQDLKHKLASPRWNVYEASGGAEAFDLIQRNGQGGGVLLLDPVLPDLDAGEFNLIVRERFPEVQILMVNSQTGQLAAEAESPTPISKKLVDTINRGPATQQDQISLPVPAVVRRNHEGKARIRNMVGDSEPMQRIFTLTRMVAERETTVLITGESGTGKDLIAQEIHLISPRRNQPYIVVNCSAIPEALLESELFGYTKGAFTGAVQSRIGRIHAAHGGTLFLDEIGDMPLALQSKILRFLEQGEVQRIGGNDNLKVDVRIVAATNANLKKKVAEGQFREDLYYRLAVFPIQLPPLRERMSDLTALVHTFGVKFGGDRPITDDAIHVLAQHQWPGNVRELRNVIERASILAGDGTSITHEHILL